MNAEEAETYHSEQISILAGTNVYMISGYTIAYLAEAIGIVRAAKSFGIPVVIAFTVGVDGVFQLALRLNKQSNRSTAKQRAMLLII